MIVTQFLHNPELLDIDKIKLKLGEVLYFIPKKNNILIIVGFLKYNEIKRNWITKKDKWEYDNEILTKLPFSIVMVCEKNERRIIKEEIKKLLNLKEEQVYIWRLRDFDGQDKWLNRLLRKKRTH